MRHCVQLYRKFEYTLFKVTVYTYEILSKIINFAMYSVRGFKECLGKQINTE